ncbi:Uncharacterised protein [Mycobacterium tuberculosis]|nr:Uncharacterised protein [Mycobacterium tuberculosis]
MDSLAAYKIGAGQQYLSDTDFVLPESRLVGLHEQRLTDGSGGLLLVQQLGTDGVAHFPKACRHCS